MFAADVAVEEVECEGNSVTIFAPPAEFVKAKTALLEAFPGLGRRRWPGEERRWRPTAA
jgi:hypothetical protein